MNQRMGGGLIRRRAILKTDVESGYFERLRDALPDLSHETPYVSLLLHIQVIKPGNMTAGKNHDVKPG